MQEHELMADSTASTQHVSVATSVSSVELSEVDGISNNAQSSSHIIPSPEEGTERQEPTTSGVATPVDVRNEEEEQQSTDSTQQASIPVSKAPSLRNQHPPIYCDMLFWIRIAILVLSIFLLILTVSYSMAQQLDTKLHIVNRCPEPKTREEIWQHSYEIALQQGTEDQPVAINEQTMFGFNNEACWTTREIEIDSQSLWTKNKYDYEWVTRITAPCVLFGLLALYWIAVIVYGIVVMTMDSIFISNGTIHLKSRLYRLYIREQQKRDNAHSLEFDAEDIPKKKTFLRRFKKRYNEIYFNYFRNDTTGWIFVKFSRELSEFVIQGIALLQYNGYNLFDPDSEDDVYLAERPDAIITFAAILSFNMLGSGILWSLYSLFPSKVYGLSFKRLIFFVDKMSDLLYSLYPLYLILFDEFNENTDDLLVLLGSLSIDSAWKFIATFIPLFFLCNYCMMMSITTTKRVRNMYFKRWKLEKALNESHRLTEMLARAESAGYSLRRSEVEKNDGKLFDDDGNLLVDIDRLPKSHDKNWIHRHDSKGIQNCRRAALITMSLSFICVAVLVLVLTMNHIDSSELQCGSVSESKFMVNGSFSNLTLSESEKQTLSTTPELFVWDQCLYKVYPFTDDERYQCQCRVFVIDWDEDLQSTANERAEYFNLTQSVIMGGVITHWTMLEKLKTVNDGGESTAQFTLNSSMNLPHLKAFDYSYAFLASYEYGTVRWPSLQYLVFWWTEHMLQIPIDLSSSPLLKYISMGYNSITDISDDVCTLEELVVFHMEFESIKSIPICMGNMESLLAIWVDSCSEITNVPTAVLNLPNLVECSIFNGFVDYQSLIEYNVPADIRNDTDKLHQWFDDNFKYDFNRTAIWFSSHPINDENMTIFPDPLKHFLESQGTTTDILPSCDTTFTPFCAPRHRGDGVCDVECHSKEPDLCAYDHGDCAQLCVAPDTDISSCTLELLVNKQCDPECHNRYCSHYSEGSTFLAPTADVDLLRCNWTTSLGIDDSFNYTECYNSVSMYTDPNIDTSIEDFAGYGRCLQSWIGDGVFQFLLKSAIFVNKMQMRPLRQEYATHFFMYNLSIHLSQVTEECLWDLQDCEVEGQYCENTRFVWNLVLLDGGLDDSAYEISHKEICGDVFDNAMLFLDGEATKYMDNCTWTVNLMDFNEDFYSNFREFTVIAGIGIGGDVKKYLGMNCSSSVDNWNPTHVN